MIDSHAHIDDESYAPDREDVLRRAFDTGVESIVTIGCDLATSRAAVDLAGRHDRISATVGFHPHEAKLADPAALEELRVVASHPRVVAWGEIGLDYYYMNSPRDSQVTAFRNQIRIARDLDLPIVIHTRDAEDDTFDILNDEKSARLRGVFHCFTGTASAAEKALEMGFLISISGIVTFPKAGSLREVVRKIPLDRLMIETDCPYLTPVPHRGKRNEPAYVRHVARQIADLRPGDGYEAVAQQTAENARRLFRIP